MLSNAKSSLYIYIRYIGFGLFGSLQGVLSKSWRQHPTRHQLYGHLPPITKTIQIRRTRHAGHCWRSSDELLSDVLLWTPTHGRAKARRPARTFFQQLCEDTGCCPEDLPRAGLQGKVASEGQGYLCYQHDMMMMMNAKSSLYIYIKYIGFGFVGFYDISTIVGYLMPNPLYTYIVNI